MLLHNYLGNNKLSQEIEESFAKHDIEMYLILAEYMDDDSKRTDFIGLDLALKFKDKKKVIILCSFLSELYFAIKYQEKWQALMSIPYLVFLRRPFSMNELFKAYELAASKTQQSLDITSTLYEESQQRKELGYIQHSYKHRIQQNDPIAIKEALKKARKHNITGSDQEILEKIISFKRDLGYSSLKGKKIQGVFCDIEGTLIKNGLIQPNVYDMLTKLSKDNKIYLWTGGDQEEIRVLLNKLNIKWNLFSKEQFSGASVEMAIDNEDLDILKHEYDIKAETFIKV